jgi:hypothetical protein
MYPFLFVQLLLPPLHNVQGMLINILIRYIMLMLRNCVGGSVQVETQSHQILVPRLLQVPHISQFLYNNCPAYLF